MYRLTLKKIAPLDQARMRKVFESMFPGAQPRPEQSCSYTLRVDNPSTTIKQYTNGTLYIESAVPSVIDTAQRVLNATTKAPDTHFVRKEATSWIGTDECGKGDYFGPLVVAGVWIDQPTEARLKRSGVRDSKEIGDDKIIILAKEIQKSCAGHYAITRLMPEEYNAYQSSDTFRGNSARMLGSLHAKVITELLATHDCDDIVIDKFGQEQHVLDFLSVEARSKNILFRHKAESNIAVAAASILARNMFLEGMSVLSDRVGVELPKGASSEVERVAVKIVLTRGQAILHTIAKLHFKTTFRVLEAAHTL